MAENQTKSELHGCIVCGKLYQLYVVYDSGGRFVDCKVMSPDGRRVPNQARPLVACRRHSQREIDLAVDRAYGEQQD